MIWCTCSPLEEKEEDEAGESELVAGSSGEMFAFEGCDAEQSKA